MTLQNLIDGASPGESAPRLAPTDIAGYVRLDQCERYLKLQLHMRNQGAGFLKESDVAPQAIPTLLTGSGTTFETAIIEHLRQRMPVLDFAIERRGPNDNAHVVSIVRALEPGQRVALTQPRIGVIVDGWDVRGDVDLLLVERDVDGQLTAIVLDMKSSSASRVEHRLQIAIYSVMLKTLFAMAEIDLAAMEIGIVYRGASDPATLPDDERIEQDRHREAAQSAGFDGACLDLVANQSLYLDAVDDLMLSQRSAARQALSKPLHETTFFFGPNCDGCFFNEFCLKTAHDRDDLSLLPFMGLDTKRALQARGVTATLALANLKEPNVQMVAGVKRRILTPANGSAAVCHDLGDHRAVAGRLDELVSRARKYQRLPSGPLDEKNNLTGAGYGTLPYCDDAHDPNLIRVFIDVQRDYLSERLYLAGALVQACDQGNVDPARRRSIVKMTEKAPDDPAIERRLLVDFIGEVLRAIVDVAAPNDDGEASAPIHLIFYERGAMTALLQALGRHADAVLGATALYDFITQLPAFDSPMVTTLADEIRALKNYPILAPSLHAVARYLGFDWDAERELTTYFRSQIFDDVRPVGGDEDGWFTGRARFSSNIPLEYAYNSWGLLPPLADDSVSERASYRLVARDDLLAFEQRRLEAIEAITADFNGNDRSYKTPFSLPDLALFDAKAPSLATAIDEFIITERHVALSAWRGARQAMPEQRMLDGSSLVVRYFEADQLPGVAEENHLHIGKAKRRAELEAQFMAENPDAEKAKLSKEEMAEIRWNHTGTLYRFEITHPGGPQRVDRLLGMSSLRVGDRVLIAERWSVDTRLPEEERVQFQTTAKQLLYGERADVVRYERETDDAGRVNRVLVTLKIANSFGGEKGFVFAGRSRLYEEGAVYTIESDPNDIMLGRGRKIAGALAEGAANGLADRLTLDTEPVTWPGPARDAQARFLDGLIAFEKAEALHGFEPQKHRYIGELGDAPTVLVQGPPGTGKSYTTAFAIWARVQGALAAGLPMRVLVSCKTHAATDVLLKNVAEVQQDLKLFSQRMPELFHTYFDERILRVPVIRYQGKGDPPFGIDAMWSKDHASMDGRKAADLLGHLDQVVVGMTPGGSWKLVTECWKDLFANSFIQLAVLDEASQMSLPEAIMSTLTLDLAGQLIVVGDHRQMPPIVQHDWANEARRSFKSFAAFESLYLALDRVVPDDHKIKFAESFRLHRDMAEFLRREIYVQDGIDYFSNKSNVLPPQTGDDDFTSAVLGPEPLVVVLHDEAESQTSNAFEAVLVSRLVDGLKDDFEPLKGLGVVVPHRAQRASLQESIAHLSIRDEITGDVSRSAIDTVERFQGDERQVIVVSLTESDPHFIRSTSEFLLDPRRLTVALSRAKEKMIVIASRSVFSVISGDETTFNNAGLWKNLLRRTCTEARWSGEIEGQQVEVRVNPPLVDA